jgi:hypothetical protein
MESKDTINQKKIKRTKVNGDIVYQESLNELRHHRNAEFTTANWNTVIMLAVIGGEISFKFQYIKGDLSFISFTTFSNIKILIAIWIIVQTLSTLYSIIYSHARYVLMREHTRDYFKQDIQMTALEYVEKYEKPIYKALKLQIFLMLGTGFLGFIAFILLLI